MLPSLRCHLLENRPSLAFIKVSVPNSFSLFRIASSENFASSVACYSKRWELKIEISRLRRFFRNLFFSPAERIFFYCSLSHLPIFIFLYLLIISVFGWSKSSCFEQILIPSSLSSYSFSSSGCKYVEHSGYFSMSLVGLWAKMGEV